MSEREKVLVMILVVAAFLVVNALAVNMFFLPKLRDAKNTEKEMKDLKLDLELALIEQEERSARSQFARAHLLDSCARRSSLCR